MEPYKRYLFVFAHIFLLFERKILDGVDISIKKKKPFL